MRREARGVRHEARGAGCAWHEAGLVRPCEGARWRGARREAGGAEAQGGSGATVRGARVFLRKVRGARRRVARHEAGGAGALGARRVRPVRTDGRPDSSIIISYWEASIIAKANCKPFGFLDNHLVNGGWSEFIDILDVSRAAELPEWIEVSDLVGP
jgi:hypothetical protein